MSVSTTKEAVTDRHRQFALLLAEGLSQSEAYGSLFPDANRNTRKVNGMKMARLPEVAKIVTKLRDEAFNEKALSRAEKRAFIARIVRGAPSDFLNKDGSVKKDYADLIQEMTVIEGKDGRTMRLKLPSKLEAVRIDNAMTGDDAPIRVEGTLRLADLMPERTEVLPDQEEQDEFEAYC